MPPVATARPCCPVSQQMAVILSHADHPMTPYDFIAKRRARTLTKRSASHQHVLDLCELLDQPHPAEADPTGEAYCFRAGRRKDPGRRLG